MARTQWLARFLCGLFTMLAAAPLTPAEAQPFRDLSGVESFVLSLFAFRDRSSRPSAPPLSMIAAEWKDVLTNPGRPFRRHEARGVLADGIRAGRVSAAGIDKLERMAYRSYLLGDRNAMDVARACLAAALEFNRIIDEPAPAQFRSTDDPESLEGRTLRAVGGWSREKLADALARVVGGVSDQMDGRAEVGYRAHLLSSYSPDPSVRKLGRAGSSAISRYSSSKLVNYSPHPEHPIGEYPERYPSAAARRQIAAELKLPVPAATSAHTSADDIATDDVALR